MYNRILNLWNHSVFRKFTYQVKLKNLTIFAVNSKKKKHDVYCFQMKLSYSFAFFNFDWVQHTTFTVSFFFLSPLFFFPFLQNWFSCNRCWVYSRYLYLPGASVSKICLAVVQVTKPFWNRHFHVFGIVESY